MHPVFPLKDVTVHRVEKTRNVKNPLYADDLWQISQTEFAMQVPGVGSFYACNGNEVEFSPVPEANLSSIELYLNGSVYGAILHQRNILPIHGSSFIWNGAGIMLCGESGTGKSSLTAAFCLNGGTFLTDDVSPIIYEKDQPRILALSDRIKLWEDSLKQMEQENGTLSQIIPGETKYYFPMEKDAIHSWPLNHIFIIEVAENKFVQFETLKGVAAFIALRNEVYRWEYLPAMPATEASYLQKLLFITQSANVLKVIRPPKIGIKEMHKLLIDQLAKL